MKRSILIAILAGVIVCAAQETPLTVAVNTTTIESFPVFAAAAAAGVKLVNVPNGRAAMMQLVSGAVDAATGSETQALINSATDPRIRIVLTLAECRYRIVARRSAGIRQIADLRGKRVAATLNTSSVYFLSRMMATVQMSERNVQVFSFEGPTMPAAIENRTVDAVAIWEPHAQNALEALRGDAVVFENGAAYTENFNLNTRTDVLNNPAKRTALRRFIREIQRVSERLRRQPAQMIPQLAPNVGLSDRTVTAVWPQFKFPAALPKNLREELNDVERWVAVQQQRGPRKPAELSTLIDAGLLRER